MMHPLQIKLAAARRRVRRLLIIYGTSRALAIVLPVLVVLGGIDYLLRFEDHGVRMIWSLAAAALVVWAIARYLAPAVRQRLSDLVVAQRIESHFAGLRRAVVQRDRVSRRGFGRPAGRQRRASSSGRCAGPGPRRFVGLVDGHQSSARCQGRGRGRRHRACRGRDLRGPPVRRVLGRRATRQPAGQRGLAAGQRSRLHASHRPARGRADHSRSNSSTAIARCRTKCGSNIVGRTRRARANRTRENAARRRSDDRPPRQGLDVVRLSGRRGRRSADAVDARRSRRAAADRVARDHAASTRLYRLAGPVRRAADRRACGARPSRSRRRRRKPLASAVLHQQNGPDVVAQIAADGRGFAIPDTVGRRSRDAAAAERRATMVIDKSGTVLVRSPRSRRDDRRAGRPLGNSGDRRSADRRSICSSQAAICS